MKLRVLCVGFTLCVLAVAAYEIPLKDKPESAVLTQDGKKGVNTKKPPIGSYGPLFTSVASLNSILEDGLQQPDPTIPQRRIPREATPQQNKRQKVRLPSVRTPLKRPRRSNVPKKPPRKVGGFSAIARPAKKDPESPKTRIAREATPQQNQKPEKIFPGKHSPLRDKNTSPILQRQRRQDASTKKQHKNRCIGCFTALIIKETPAKSQRSRRSGGKGKKRRKTPPGGGALIQQIRKQDEKSRKKREEQDPQQSLTLCPGCYGPLSKPGVNPTYNPEENANEGKPQKRGRRHGGVRGRKKKHGPPGDADHHGGHETGRPHRKRGSRRRNKERHRHERKRQEGSDTREWALDEIHTKVPETGASDEKVMTHKSREKRNTGTKRSQRKFALPRNMFSGCPGCFSISALMDYPVVTADPETPYVEELPVAEEFNVFPKKQTPD